MITQTKFNKLTAAGKRVAIAKDAKAQILAKKITVAHCYLEPRGATDTINQERLLKPTTRCSACAAGSLLIATVRIANKWESWGDASAHEVAEGLLCYFSSRQIAMIESAFEADYSMPATYVVGESYSNAARKGADSTISKIKGNRKRLLAILNNIIRNKGTFKP